jgi:hypothetical protein
MVSCGISHYLTRPAAHPLSGPRNRHACQVYPHPQVRLPAAHFLPPSVPAGAAFSHTTGPSVPPPESRSGPPTWFAGSYWTPALLDNTTPVTTCGPLVTCPPDSGSGSPVIPPVGATSPLLPEPTLRRSVSTPVSGGLDALPSGCGSS